MHSTQLHQRPRILVIYTGGTIGMIEDPKTKALKPFDFSNLIDNVPKIKMLDYDIENIQFTPIDSANMSPEHWVMIAKAIYDNYSKFDGFVLLHGTDTMSYTASALSFMLENLHKPVVITGSQLPIGEVRTDGEENLITALQVAAARDAKGDPMVQEVAILFENFLWRGNRSTKKSANNFNAFTCHNYPPLAKIGLGIDFCQENLYRIPQKRPLKLSLNLDTNVVLLDLFPGLHINTVRHILATPGLKGVVMRTYGAGNAPTNPAFIEAITEAVDRGIVILNVSQCSEGATLGIYETGDTLVQAGVIGGVDITCEAAVAKLMYLFGSGLPVDTVKGYLNCSICGEVSL